MIEKTVVMALLVALVVVAGGCAWEARPAFTGLSLTITRPIVIPSGRAHAILQAGRLAPASNKFEPYCELEVRTVSGATPQRLTSGEFRVGRTTQRLLLDPTTRIPAVFVASSCADPLFQESVWWLASAEPSDVLFLRCIAPYYNCAFGPPLSPDQVQQQVAPYLAVRVAGPASGRS
jgi:hypothetical protein